MKVLITGGAGFIGSHLANALANGKNEIYIVDDLSMGKIENIQDVSNVHFFKKSVCDYKFMHSLLKRNKFDYIFFLAAIASVADSIERPWDTHMVNSESVINALEFIRSQSLPVKKILFTSSAAVYGNSKELPKKEGSTINPLSPYAIDKFSAERYMIDYNRLYNLPTVCVRFFNVYGPHQNPESPYSGVLSILTKCLKRGVPFRLYGNGEQTRDFIYVEDVVNALLAIVHRGINGTVFNVANGKETSLIQLIRMYEQVANKGIQIKHCDSRRGDIKRSVADVRRLISLGFESEWDIESGLNEYWKSVKGV